VSNGINLFKNDNNSVIIITHSTKLLKNLDVDYVHVLVDGKIVLSGDASLADKIDKEGYKNIIEGLKNEN
jgi:Fe-S cluster assembly ATP-binding protein